MEFFIRKDSLEPVLKMQLIQDGRNDFRKFYQGLENAILSFSMKKVDTGEYVILNKAAGIVQKTEVDPTNDPEYYIYYRWQPTDVMEEGRYQGQFLIEFLISINIKTNNKKSKNTFKINKFCKFF